jgi:hypothetical protein
MTGGTLEVEKLTEVVGLLPTTSRANRDFGNISSPLEESRKKLGLLKLQEKIVKLKKKHKSKKMKVLESSSSLSSNQEGDTSSSDESIMAKRAKKRNEANLSYNTTSFNYSSLPSNHSFTSVHIGKPPRFD